MSNKKYTVVLDEFSSYLEESSNGYSFDDACDEIIDYASSANYISQVKVWEKNKKFGESNYK